MRARIVLVLVSSALGAFAACTSENLPPAGSSPSTVQPGGAVGAGSEAGGGGGDSGSSGGEGGTCNQLMFGGKLVDALNVVGDPTPPTGGTVLDGDYDLTNVNVYVGVTGTAGPAGFSEQSSINVTAGAIQRLTTLVNTATNQTTTSNDSGTLVVPDSGTTTLIVDISCPNTGFLEYDFTATGTSVRLVNPTTKTELTYTKR